MYDRKRFASGATGNPAPASVSSRPRSEPVWSRSGRVDESTAFIRRPAAWAIGMSVVVIVLLTVRHHDDGAVRSAASLPRATVQTPERVEPEPVVTLASMQQRAQGSNQASVQTQQTETSGNGLSGIEGSPSPRTEHPATIQETTQLRLEPATNGNYYLKGSINGQTVTFLIDTGASWISIPDRLRWRLNLRKGRYVSVSTASGVVGNYETRVDALEFGPFRFENVLGVLNPYAPNDIILLGMSALKEMDFSQSHGELVLSRANAPGAAAIPEPLHAPEPDLVIRRPVRECMGHSGVIDATTLRCLEGR